MLVYYLEHADIAFHWETKTITLSCIHRDDNFILTPQEYADLSRAVRITQCFPDYFDRHVRSSTLFSYPVFDNKKAKLTVHLKRYPEFLIVDIEYLVKHPNGQLIQFPNGKHKDLGFYLGQKDQMPFFDQWQPVRPTKRDSTVSL